MGGYVFCISNVCDGIPSRPQVLRCLGPLLLFQVVFEDLENHVGAVSHQFLINPDLAFLLLFQPISVDL